MQLFRTQDDSKAGGAVAESNQRHRKLYTLQATDDTSI